MDQADGKELLTVYNRTLITHNKLVFGFVGAYNIFKNILAKNSLMLGYHIDEKNSVYLRLWNSEFRKAQLDFKNWRSYFETITFNLISNYNANTKLGLEVLFT